MQILIIEKEFEAIECKFQLFVRDSMYLKPKSNRDRKVSNANSKHLKEIRSIRMQI